MLPPQVTQHIATCQPLSGALDNGRVILCDMVADPWVSVPQFIGAGGHEAPMGRAAEQGPAPGLPPVLPSSSEIANPRPSWSREEGGASEVGRCRCPTTVS